MRAAQFALLIAVLACGPRLATACGAKTLATLASPSFGECTVPVRANVVVYSQAGSKGASRVAERSMQRALKRAGHNVHVCTAPNICTDVLSGGFDVIVADAKDMPGIRKLVDSKGVKPAFLPTVFKASKRELSSLRETYRVVLNLPTSPSKFLYRLNEALMPN